MTERLIAMLSVFFRVRNIILIMVVVVACNSNVVPNSSINNLNDTVNYPKEIIRLNMEKKYDNAVWLAYASNYHSKAICVYGKAGHVLDSNIISLEPVLSYIKEIGNGDTVELVIFFTPSTIDSCRCYSKQEYGYVGFYFLKHSDDVLYRQLGGSFKFYPQYSMLNKKDSVRVPHAFDRENGMYPIDEQDSLFRLYVKEHKNQLAPTLLRLCKEKKVF